MKGETEKTLFAACFHFGADIEEHRRRTAAWLQHVDDSRLLQDEQPIGAVASVSDECGACDAAHDNRDELYGCHCWRGKADKRDRKRNAGVESFHRSSIGVRD